MDRTSFREILAQYFDAGELRTLCFDLGIDYESLPGETKDDQARELVGYVYRHGRAFELLRAVHKQCPNAFWNEALMQAVNQATQPTVEIAPVRLPSGRSGPLRQDYRALLNHNPTRINARVDELDKRVNSLRVISVVTLVLTVFIGISVVSVAAVLVTHF